LISTNQSEMELGFFIKKNLLFIVQLKKNINTCFSLVLVKN